MFENYLATSDDLKTIKEALGFVFHPKMKFVFSDYSRILKTLAISYDSRYIYVWCLEPIKLTKIPHNLKISDEHQLGWRAGMETPEIVDLLPTKVKNATRFEIPTVSGGLLTPFITLQKAKKVSDNPYTTKDSYLATIIHEFGHVYWNSFKLWWPSSKEKNINLLEEAKKLYTNKITDREFNTKYPSPIYASEVFAHCTEYYASEIFWPKHKNDFDKFAISQINTMVSIEKNRNLTLEDSVLEPTKNPHNYSLIVGKLLISKHPKDWPNLLTNP